MYEDLEGLANLKLGKAMEAISQEMGDRHRKKISDLSRRGLTQSGMMAEEIIDSQIDRCRRICGEIEAIWKDLIVRRDGKISKEAVDFIIEKVRKTAESCASTVPHQVVQIMGNSDWAEQKLARGRDRAVADIRRDLVIHLRESELFPTEQKLTERETLHGWDLFISHASEDKEGFVRPFAEAIRAKGLKVWYDDFTLRIGDSLRRSIDRGLANSRYGIVVLSPSFFAKQWTQWELDGLVEKEIKDGRKVILPVWHKVTHPDVFNQSPSLADKKAFSSEEGIDKIVAEILDVIREE